MSTAYAVLDAADRNTGCDIGTVMTTTPALTGDTFPPGSDVYLRVKTAGTNTSTPTVTWPTAVDSYGVAKKNFQLNGGVAIPITQDRLFGPFPAAEFADPSDGQVHLMYNNDTVAGTLVGAYRLTNG